MLTVLWLVKYFPEDWEPSRIWLIAAIEGLIIDAPLLGILARVIAG
jgi:hypothetical protein